VDLAVQVSNFDSMSWHRAASESCLPEILHIATAADQSYLLPLKVTLASLRDNLRPSLRPVVYLLNRDLSDAEVDGIDNLVETHSIVPGDEAIERLARDYAFPVEAAFPLLLADVLPESVERVLFIDPDLLVLDDVGEIWETRLGGNVVAAVTDQAIPVVSSPRGLKDWRARGIPADAPYFNGGVLLMDLARWRSHDVTGRALQYLAMNRGRIDFFHQSALNAILWDKWLRLDQRWNLVASLAGRPYGSRNSAGVDNPGIVHFAGKFKPWRVRIGGPFAASYYDELSRHGWNSHRGTGLERLLGIYDRYLRDHLYDTEHLLWKNRLI
jgi:lipopolysaccharide biosynthesis glycosyltransferase